MRRSGTQTKYVLLVGDGMADYPLDGLGGRTPLEAARTPHMDRIAACRIGTVQTVPAGMEAGSDVANLALLGYDPRRYQTGRAPLEAASMGIPLGPRDVAFRMNLVTLEHTSPAAIWMRSHSAGDISGAEGAALVAHLKAELHVPGVDIYPGVAYRNLWLWRDGPEKARTIPPHDVLDQNMAPYLTSAPDDPVVQAIRASWPVLADQPVNLGRRKKGLPEATSIWLWGQGRAPVIPSFDERFGLKGGVISAVDLLRGIGVSIGFVPIAVEGITGYLNTNFRGKAMGALDALASLDFVMVHVEAPDEAGHAGHVGDKVLAIEAFDAKVVGPVLEGLERFEDYRVMVVSDHFTPIVRRTHTTEPPPFAWATRNELKGPGRKGVFSEAAASGSPLFYPRGHDLMPDFLGAA